MGIHASKYHFTFVYLIDPRLRGDDQGKTKDQKAIKFDSSMQVLYMYYNLPMKEYFEVGLGASRAVTGDVRCDYFVF